MKRVFLGGSRRVSRLNANIRKRLNEIVVRQMQVMVGDANGADRALQRQLADWAYPHVVVYFVGAKPRNNEGAWPTFHVETAPRARGYEFYAQKDREMAKQAECGMMLWDGQSRGTLENVQNLVQRGAPVALYLSPAKKFVNIRSEEDLGHLRALSNRDEAPNSQKQEAAQQTLIDVPKTRRKSPKPGDRLSW